MLEVFKIGRGNTRRIHEAFTMSARGEKKERMRNATADLHKGAAVDLKPDRGRPSRIQRHPSATDRYKSVILHYLARCFSVAIPWPLRAIPISIAELLLTAWTGRVLLVCSSHQTSTLLSPFGPQFVPAARARLRPAAAQAAQIWRGPHPLF